jgi:hypothetical protein
MQSRAPVKHHSFGSVLWNIFSASLMSLLTATITLRDSYHDVAYAGAIEHKKYDPLNISSPGLCKNIILRTCRE